MKFLKRNPPDMPVDVAAGLVRTHYGLEGELTAFESERDQNFRVETPDRSFLFKVCNADEDPDVVDQQISALKHIELVDPNLPVPRAVPTVTGADSFRVTGPSGARHLVRLMSYLDGVIADRLDYDTPEFRHNTGVILARLDLALRGFSHPAANQDHPWTLMRVPRLLEKVGHISDESARHHVVVILERVRDQTIPACLGLRHQVIHQDAHTSNLVVDPDRPAQIEGIIDFGDMADGPLIAEIAVAAHFSGRPQATPETLIDIVLGYNSVTPLEPAEIEVVYYLALARLAMSTTIMAARAALFPDENSYGPDQGFLWNRIASYAEAGPAITEQIRRKLGFSRPLATTG